MDILKLINSMIKYGFGEELIGKILAGMLKKETTQEALIKIFSDLIKRDDVQKSISNAIARYLNQNFGKNDKIDPK